MTVPERTPPDPAGPIVQEETPVITREVLQSYLLCKLKGHLKLKGQTGSPSDYETMMTRLRAKVAKGAAEKLAARRAESDVARDITITTPALKLGTPLILRAMIEAEGVRMEIDGLKRVDGPSKLGDFHYVPILFFEGEKVRPDQRRSLELCGLLVGDLQGKQPSHGLIVHGEGLRTSRVEFKSRPRATRRIVEEIKVLASAGSPPDVLLKDHCQVCEFRQKCHLQAVGEDNLSLLRGLGEKAISKLKRRGISTVTQLSCTFRPRKRYGKDRANHPSHSFALQAMALREGKVFILGAPELPDAEVRIFFDVEGDPDRGFDYMIGMLIEENGTEQFYSLWADSPEQEAEIVERFLEIVEKYESPRLFCYGAYEAAFLRRMRQPGRRERIDRVLGRTTNVLSVIYSSVYFPVYSNGLKEVAGRLGCRWSRDDASGLQSVVWRRAWEIGRDQGLKRTLEVYNMEDCIALRAVCRFISGIKVGSSPEDGGGGPGGIALEHEKVEEKPNDFGRREWCKASFSIPDFDFINKLSYFDYQREKVYIRSSPTLRRIHPRRQKRKRSRHHVEERIVLRSESCPHCGGTSVSDREDGRLARLVMDLKFSRRGIRGRWIEVASYRHACLDCRRSFVPPDYFRVDRHSHSLKSWAMYEHVAHRASFPTLKESLGDCFGMQVQVHELHAFQFLLAEYYKETVRLMTRRLVAGGLIHIDETEVHVKGVGKAYVWVFTNLEEVVFLYRPNRVGDFLHEFLKGFDGVLVSDFFSAYDSLPCKQQKCLIHLIRDFNHDILGNPFDEELKALAAKFGALLREIVTTIDRHGLRHKYLCHHKEEVDQFFEFASAQDYQSEVARGYQNRLEKNREKLFTFIDHDGVPWNNNNAEHAIKKFAYYREIADGLFSESSLQNYLTLLSVEQTCAYRGIGFLRFLLSQERDIEAFRRKGSHAGKAVPYDLYPEGFVPTNRKEYFDKRLESKGES
jgi:predicted RecB family nuclease